MNIKKERFDKFLSFFSVDISFIEGMYCQGGCMNGPATLEEFTKSKRAFEKLHSQSKKEGILQNVSENGADKQNSKRPKE